MDHLRAILSNTFLSDGSDEDKLSCDLAVEGISRLRPLANQEGQSNDGTDSAHGGNQSGPSYNRLHSQQQQNADQQSNGDDEETTHQQTSFKVEMYSF